MGCRSLDTKKVGKESRVFSTDEPLIWLVFHDGSELGFQTVTVVTYMRSFVHMITKKPLS